MHNNPSRREIREQTILRMAEKGTFSTILPLYGSEEKSLTKNGFTVVRPTDNRNKPIASTVSWEDAFKNGIPPAVIDYIYGVIETFPRVSNWAQEIHVIAARASRKNGTN